MAKSNSVLPKLFCLIIFVISFDCNDASSKRGNQVDLPNFDQIKNDLFYGDHSNILNKSSEYGHQNDIELVQCLDELNAIKNGLISSKQWAKRSKITSFESK